MINWLASALFTSLMFLTVVPWSFATICVRPFGLGPAFAVASSWGRMICWLCETLCGLRYSVEGMENLPEAASVAMVKHSSAYETIVLLNILPRQIWVLKRELIWAPFFGWALATLEPIAIDRSGGRAAVTQVIEQGRRKIADGAWVIVFPEGTRMPAGETRRYGASGALLAQESGALLVPIAHNAGDFWPRRGLRKLPGTVRFVIGKAVDPAGRDAREVNEEIQAWVEATVARLREPAGSENPGIS